MCLFPKLIRNKKYTKTQKNGGIIPPVSDERTLYVPIGCQNCIECRKQKARSWRVRLLEDIKENTNGKFITLTFSNESIKELNTIIDKEITELENKLKTDPKNILTKKRLNKLQSYGKDNAIATKGIRLFLERWRKEYGTSLRHWMVTELGHQGTENIHIHGIIWTNESIINLDKIWKYGFVWKGYIKNGKIINYVNDRTVNYTVKYVHKIDLQHKTFKSKILTSAGIGKNYTNGIDYKQNKYNGIDTQETYRTRTGHKINLPIYWRNKIYTEQQREQLWLIKLDKQERWICGDKVDISKGEEEYYKLLKYHQIRNKQLRYGTDKTSWAREQYEKERAEIMRIHRIKNIKEKPTRENKFLLINKYNTDKKYINNIK